MKRTWIDGYNLLHASGVFPTTDHAATLEQARRALCTALSEQLSEREARGVTVFFDGAEAPRGVAAEYTWAGLAVVFSRQGQSADDLLAERLAADRQPKQLTIVSSDHGVQRTARQRGASYIDSDQWLRQVRSAAALRSGEPAKQAEPEKPAAGDCSELEMLAREAAQLIQQAEPPRSPPKAPARRRPHRA